MNATNLIQRMMLSPQPLEWAHNMYRRQMLASIQPVDDPSVVTVRPYGIAKGLGMTQFPQDYTLRHYGGTLRGAKIGQWKKSLMVSTDPQPFNAPTLFSWRSSSRMPRLGEQWVPESWNDEEV